MIKDLINLHSKTLVSLIFNHDYSDKNKRDSLDFAVTPFPAWRFLNKLLITTLLQVCFHIKVNSDKHRHGH